MSEIQVGFRVLRELPKEPIDRFSNQLTQLSIATKIEERKPDIVNLSIDIDAETAIQVFVAAAFFRGFFSEAGKDAYNSVKKGLAILFKEAGDLPVYILRAGKITGKGRARHFGPGEGKNRCNG